LEIQKFKIFSAIINVSLVYREKCSNYNLLRAFNIKKK